MTKSLVPLLIAWWFWFAPHSAPFDWRLIGPFASPKQCERVRLLQAEPRGWTEPCFSDFDLPVYSR